MKGIVAALAAIVMLSSVSAYAGVVLEEHETMTQGPPARPGSIHNRTMMIEGHKEKLVADNRTTIIDLDKGTVTVLNPADKTYFESMFPAGQESPMAKQSMGQNLSYKKTGTTKTVAGYGCVEYSSSAKNANGEFSTTACFSKEAPGAADYVAFQKAAAQKLKLASVEASENIPDGVPLETHSSRKITGFSMPGLPPAQAKMLGEMMAKRPPVISDSQVTKISSQSLPADTFAIPKGFTEREMHGMKMGPGHMVPGAPMGGGPMMPGAPAMMRHPPTAGAETK
jgi:hypothetical protein